MDDKHEPGPEDTDAIARLAGLDPAEAPEPAEELAAELASELESAGAAPTDQSQTQANPGDTTSG